MEPKKKRNTPSHSKSSSTAKNTIASGGAPPYTSSNDNLPEEQINAEQLDNDAIKAECELAIAALGQRNLTEALKLINDACLHYENSALVHHTRASIYTRIAAQIEDYDAYQEHLKNALESAKKAISISPHSIKFSHTHASLLFRLSSNVEDYEEVVKECERALSLFNLPRVEKSSQEQLEFIKEELKSILDKAKIGLMVVTGTKNVGTADGGEEGSVFKEDPMLTNIKKANKTIEEKRKEIMALLQERPKTVPSQNIDDDAFGLTGPKLIGKLQVRKRNSTLKKIMLNAGKIGKVLEFWTSMSVEEKTGLLRPRINDCKMYCARLKGVLAAEDLLGGICYAEVAQTWKYWDCCVCGQVFMHMDSFIGHLKQRHLGPLLAKLQEFLPQQIDTRMVEMLEDGPWKPVDTAEAVRIIKNQSKDPDDKNWPFSDDSERADILQKIHSRLQVHLRHKWVALSHLMVVKHYAMNMLLSNNILSATQIWIHGLHRSHVCMCFLEASELNNILDVLQALDSQMGSIADEWGLNQECEARERIVFCGETLCLIFDESLLHGEITPSTCPKAVADDPSATTFVVSDDELGDAFIRWLFAGFTIEEKLASWRRLKDVKARRGMKICLILKKMFSEIENSCLRIQEHFIHEKALEDVHSICAEELKKREQGASYIPQTFESLLKKRQEELLERDDDNSRAEPYCEGKILEDEVPQAMNVNKVEFEKLMVSTCHFCEFECMETDECIMQDDVHQGDNRIRNVIEKQLRQSATENFKMNINLLWSFARMHHLYFQLAQVSVHDYQLIVVPLLKSFMRSQLEDLVQKYATAKTNAAREALLAELESVGSKNLTKGCNQAKHRDKKKKRNYRKAKDPKVSGGQRKDMLKGMGTEQAHFPDGDYPDSQMHVSESANEMIEQEEEHRFKLQLEAEERMLEENLERQRKIENEAKQKQLSGQNKSTNATAPDVTETLVIAPGMPNDFPGVPMNKFEVTKMSSLVSRERTEGRSCYDGEVKPAFAYSETLDGVLWSSYRQT
ncbi:unnamed protein product [Ilex paraguariensis]|uniref:C2H2-type domain-containing protein n=1 Tax=Ilex paraguariensis TaxID=185542 RepID=A0ABC8U0T7_9AQUA